MQISNTVSPSGFLIGWQPAKLGNALSSLANLFVLCQRIGLPGAYPLINIYSDIFKKGSKISIWNCHELADYSSFQELLVRLESILCADLSQYAPERCSSFFELGQANVSNVVWLSRYEGAVVRDWCADGSERHVKEFCRRRMLRRGNGLIITGAYWRQYTDMRLLKDHGADLRRHLGDLSSDGLGDRSEHMQKMADAIKIGIHIRQGDYKIWHNGIFYYSIAEYLQIVDRITAEMGSKRHIFYIFFDSNLNEEINNYANTYVSQGSFADDFIAMSKCDIIVGPPSTFSTWSAFLGGAKRIVVTREIVNDSKLRLLDKAVDIFFPTGSYMPNDEKSGPI